MAASETFYVIDTRAHAALVAAAYSARGFNQAESEAAAEVATQASWHGIRTHNAIKALHLDDRMGSKAGGCVPGAEIEVLPNRFNAAEVWNAHRKLGQSVAVQAIQRCIQLADTHGVGMVSVDEAFHYLWGGAYVLQAARKGYIAYTHCTAALAEVVPFKGKFPTLGTNPHSWAFPTQDVVGFPILIDWATSVIAMGRVQQLAREGQPLPPNAAVDEAGNPTTDANAARYLLPFGAHKGYGLSLINEIVAAYTGGSLPTLRSRWDRQPEEKHTPTFFFQVIHPDAISSGRYALERDRQANIKAVLEDIRGHGNEGVMLPGEVEAANAARSQEHGGLLFSQAELDALNEIAAAIQHPALQPKKAL